MSTGWTEADIPRLNPQRVERIRSLLTEALNPTAIEVADDSHKHAGHAGARGGQGISASISSAKPLPASCPWPGTGWCMPPSAT